MTSHMTALKLISMGKPRSTLFTLVILQLLMIQVQVNLNHHLELLTRPHSKGAYSMTKQTCINPNCPKPGTGLILNAIESTPDVRKLFCPCCGRIYNETTTIGKAIRQAPLYTAAAIGLSILTGDLERAVDLFIDGNS
jgi:hypothetical protein